MPRGEPDPSDPNVLIGVCLPAEQESLEEMARSFAEEFASLGYDEERLMEIFRRPHYAGAHQAYRVLGESVVRRLVRESLEIWGRYRVKVVDKEKEGPTPGECARKQRRSHHV